MKKGPPRERDCAVVRSVQQSKWASLSAATGRTLVGIGRRGGGGRVDQVWTPGVRVSAAKMDWLISKHLNPSMSEAA